MKGLGRITPNLLHGVNSRAISGFSSHIFESQYEIYFQSVGKNLKKYSEVLKAKPRDRPALASVIQETSRHYHCTSSLASKSQVEIASGNFENTRRNGRMFFLASDLSKAPSVKSFLELNKPIFDEKFTLLLLKCLQNQASSKKSAADTCYTVLQWARHSDIRLDDEHYRTMMRAYLESGQPTKAIHWLEECKLSGINISRKTYLIALANLEEAGRWQEVERLVEDMHDSGGDLRPDEIVYATLIQSFMKSGQIQRALEILTLVEKEGINTSGWAHIILVETFSNMGQTDTAFGLFKDLKEKGVLPDHRTCESLLSALANSPNGQYTHAMELWDTMHDPHLRFKLDTSAYTKFISICSFHGEVEKAFAIFEKMRDEWVMPSSDTYTALLSACTHIEGYDKYATTLWDTMRAVGCTTSLYAYVALVKAVCSPDLDCQAKFQAVCDDLRQNAIVPKQMTNESIHSVCTKYWSKDFDRSQLLEMLKEIWEVKSDSGLDIYHAVLNAYAQGGHVDEAFILCTEMGQRGLVPNSDTFCFLLTGLKNSEDTERATYRALEIWEDMMDCEIKPSEETYTTLIQVFGNKGDIQGAFETFERMQLQGVQPTVGTYNGLLTACANYKGKLNAGCRALVETMRLAKGRLHEKREMQSFYLPNIKSLQASRAAGAQVEKALQVYDEMCSKGIKADSKTFHSLLQTFDVASNMMKSIDLYNNHLLKRMHVALEDVHVNTLVSTLWKCGHFATAVIEMESALERDVFPHAKQHLGNIIKSDAGEISVVLDLQGFSVGSALARIVLWLCKLHEHKEVGIQLPPTLRILTGLGNVSKITGTLVVNEGIKAYFTALRGNPFVETCDIHGVRSMVADTDQVLTWISQLTPPSGSNNNATKLKHVLTKSVYHEQIMLFSFC